VDFWSAVQLAAVVISVVVLVLTSVIWLFVMKRGEVPLTAP
jgi:hypothetical protein